MTAWLLLLPLMGQIEATAKTDPNVPFRTDLTNEHLPWYRLKPGEFPPPLSEHVVDGVLLEADFIHRSGQFRRMDNGQLVDFAMPPFGTVLYLNAEADLRDVPIGTLLHFSMYQDERGAFTKVVTIRDEFTALSVDGSAYRLDEIKAGEGKLVVTLQTPPGGRETSGSRELRVDQYSRLRKNEKPAKITNLAVGDSLLVNLRGDGRCADVWAGVETHRLVAEAQRKRHNTFLRARGLAGWIDRVEGKQLTVTLFGEPEGLRALMKDEGIDPARWATEHRSVDAVVANEELRTYNPPVDRKRSTVLKYERVPGGHGNGGVRWVIEPDLLLEGFRKGRVIRLFAQPSWPVNDMAFGETLYSEAPDFKPDDVDPNLYPYRTDSGNEHLPWYRPRPNEFPPFHSHHRVSGELLKVDDHGRSGRFRADLSGELVNFTMPPYGSVMYLNAEADLSDVPTGTRCHFYLHQDDRGSFTKAAVILDEFTRLASDAFTVRLEESRLDLGKILVGKQHAPVKNEKEEFVRPPDFGREEFAVDHRTRVWKGDKRATLGDLALGDELLVNTTGRTGTSRGVCTDIWAGVEKHRLVTSQQRATHTALLKERGLPAWIDNVDGKKLTITFFAGNRREFPSILNGDPGGESVYALLADDELRPMDGALVKLAYLDHPPEADTAGAYGCSGVRWRIEASILPDGFRPGRILRIFKAGWRPKTDSGKN
ncbi:MAG: hypothetical protein JWN86_4699 [Planctomycetota bacterium]|nr:hypothetical protein [Planctomycetota bacterium]